MRAIVYTVHAFCCGLFVGLWLEALNPGAAAACAILAICVATDRD